MRLIVCICSYGRRRLLENCLRSFAGQSARPSWEVAVLVIDNNPAPLCHEVIEAVKSAIPFPISCVPERTPGIPSARNRAIEEALAGGADWIAFVDDDEILDPDWLAAMTEAPERFEAEVYHGPVEPVFPDSESPVWIGVSRRDRADGKPLRTAATNNVMLHRNLVAENGMGLRFDTNMQFSGGSDNDFFYRASDAGARIVWVDSARVSENVPKARLTYRYQVQRAFCNAANATFGQMSRKGRLSAFWYYGVKALGRLLVGLLYGLVTPVGVLFGRRRFRWIALKAGRHLAWVLGFLSAFTPWRPQPYRRENNA